VTSLIRRFRLSAVLACAAATFATAATSDVWAQGTGNGVLPIAIKTMIPR